MLKYTTVSADASSKPTRTGLLTGQHRQSSANNSTKKLQRVFKRVNLKHGELGAGDPDCSMDDELGVLPYLIDGGGSVND